MSHGNSPVRRLGWAFLLLAAALGSALWLVARRSQGDGPRWLLQRVGAPSMAMEPLRDEVQLLPWSDAAPVIAELPGGYPVVANTRPTPAWRGVSRAQSELRP